MIISVWQGENPLHATQYGFPLFWFRKNGDSLTMFMLFFRVRTWTSLRRIAVRKSRWLSIFGVSAVVYEAEHEGAIGKIVVCEK